ncbi:hypothetical protein FQN60_015671 [Etheostoma spectabile]|uniref:Uncharacterized protein n=1 Tax=Etheostoma spectabile TaxID=54343 RepID=A0A5J5CRB4_9PERO|nr:hypothetical protein FQN60_015671 [Etheostoma spectabile]
MWPSIRGKIKFFFGKTGNDRNKTHGGIGNPLLNGFFDKRKVESCTQQMVRGEWIRAEHDRLLLTQNKGGLKHVSQGHEFSITLFERHV